jgi:dsDNA-specific endonuclease/ATPase MutS2
MIALLAHAGLPVPATSAKISLVEEIHILAKVNGTQSAGALERTLMRLAEVFISERRKLVLADELEAITEPGAAARILSGLLFEAMKNDCTTVVLVTHIGGQIRENFNGEIRIDGIEARGLDENLELVVDRTPIRNHLAQSTPELIVRRLAARAEGPASVLFASLSKRFKE